MLFPQRSFKRAPRKIKACLTGDWELCLQDGKDRNPPPLHLARPGGAGEQEAVGRGGEELPPRALPFRRPAGSSAPARPSRAHLPAAAPKHAPSLPRSQAASEGWGLRSWYRCLVFPFEFFFLFLFAKWVLVGLLGFFFQFV